LTFEHHSIYFEFSISFVSLSRYEDTGFFLLLTTKAFF
jgi:hypothetical protein